jgi:hypothetical protein
LQYAECILTISFWNIQHDQENVLSICFYQSSEEIISYESDMTKSRYDLIKLWERSCTMIN